MALLMVKLKLRARLHRFLTTHWPLMVFLLCYGVFTAAAYPHFGATTDESFEYGLGKQLYIYFRGHDPVITTFLSGAETESQELLQHNRLYPAILYVLNGSDSIDLYHFWNLVFGALLFICAYELLLAESRRPLLSLTGPLFFFCTPLLFGHIPANPKDIPFAWSFLLALTVLYFLTLKQTWWLWLPLGISVGVAGALRTAGYVLLPLSILTWWWETPPQLRKKHLLTLLGGCLILFICLSVIQLGSQPYVAHDPLHRWLQLLLGAKEYAWRGSMLVFGRLVPATQLPLWYVPLWVAITTPIMILVLALGSLALVHTSRLVRLLWRTVVLIAIVFVVTRPIVYDGLRHFLFILPLLGLLAARTFIHIWLRTKKTVKTAVILLCCINVGLIALHYVRFFPYHYVYFNELIGGPHGAYQQFELDYWGASYREAVIWLNAHQPPEAKLVYTCSDPQQTQWYLSSNWQLTSDVTKADFAICSQRDKVFRELQKTATEVHTVQRSQLPLVSIFQLK